MTMMTFCVICAYKTPDGVSLKAVTNGVPAPNAFAAYRKVAASLETRGATEVALSKATQTSA